jgi:hypothetical protein
MSNLIELVNKSVKENFPELEENEITLVHKRAVKQLLVKDGIVCGCCDKINDPAIDFDICEECHELLGFSWPRENK